MRNMSMAILLLFCSAVCPGVGPALYAQDPTVPSSPKLVIKRLTAPVTLDGLSGEPAWRDVAPIEFTQHSPNFGHSPSERTELLVGFDDVYLYIAGRLYDSEPDKIQTGTKKRDSLSPSNEWFGVIVDTFNDKENALAFFTTPSGLRFDAAVYNDAQPARMDAMEMPLNMSWNTFWDVKTVINDQGWFAEMRIPLSSLRFQEKGGLVTMGLISWRLIPRKNEMCVFPDIPPNWGMWSSWKPSQAREITLEGVRSRKPLYITPYGLAGAGRTAALNADEDAYAYDNDPVGELGLDIKYGLTSNMILDLTLNTDFAQVEADDQQVNLTRFSLFFPEKRMFFQERSSTFEFNTGGPNRLFYSRRIGLHDEDIVRIYGGVRLVGRVGAWDLGIMDMQTAATDELPSENFGIFRLRRQVFNANSYVGGMVTSRIGRDGSYNAAYGLDGIIRMFGLDYLSLNWAQTFSDEAEHDNQALSLDPTKLRISWERRTINGLGYNLSYSRAGKAYDPGMGFEMREDYTRYGAQAHYGWIPGENSPINTHRISLGGSVTLSNQSQEVESAEFGPGWTGETKTGWGASFQPKYYQENLTEIFELSDEVEVPLGRYSYAGLEAMFYTPMGQKIGLMSLLQGGEFYDGTRLSWSFIPRWNPNSTWELEGFYEYNRVVFPERDQDLTAHLARLRILATLSTKVAVSAFVQYNGADNLVIGNLRFRYNPREGNDFYLVYNEVLNTDRYRESPALPRLDTRAILLKYSYTFNIH
jgi:hypothetical protein